MAWIGAAIAGGSSLAGGLLNFFGQQAQRNQDMEIHQQNIALQREFAQNGIRWRAEDARAAGIHPAFAMGAPVTSFSPQQVGSQPNDFSFVGKMGQDIGRAIDATRTKDDRHTALVQALALERGALENQLLAAQIAKLSQVGPPMPSGAGAPQVVRAGIATPDPGALGEFKVDPAKVLTTNPQAPSVEAGPLRPQNVWAHSMGGKVQGFPSQDLIQDQEITNPLMARWMLTQGWRKPPANLLPKGAIDWSWAPDGWSPVYPGGASGRVLGRALERVGVNEGVRSLYLNRSYR